MKKIDFFSEPVRTLLNKQITIKTTIGGYFTVLMVIMALIFTWFIGRDAVYREKPYSYQQKDIFEKFQNITINKTHFPFSFTMMDDENVPLVDYSYLTLKLYEKTYNLNSTTSIYNLTAKHERPVKFCNYSDFALLTPDKFESAQLGSTLCPETNNFNLYGYWNEPDLNYLQISIERCKNTTDSDIVCKSPKEIEEFIAQTGTNLNIFFVDSRVRISNNTDPLEFLSTIQYKYVIPEFYKKTTYKIQSENIVTDNGFIFSVNDDIQFFRMVEEFTDIRVIDPEDYQFLVFEIFSSNISDTYFRRYLKVPDIIASLGGILKVLTIGFIALNTIFSEVEKNISIVNEVFVLNRHDSISVQSLDKITSKMNLSTKHLIKGKRDEKILTNNFILPDPPKNEKEKIYGHTSNFNSVESQNDKIYTIDLPHKTAHLESPVSLFKNAKVTKFSLAGSSNDNNFNNIHHNLNSIDENNNNKNNNNFNTNNFIKQNSKEEEKSANRHGEENKSIVEKYLKVRKSETKLLYGCGDIMNIVCNNYCKRKIPSKFLEKFHFYENARNSVSHYFDFIFMIKKFEEINILKKFLLHDEQEKMVDIISKPILSSKEFLTRTKTIRSTKDSVDLHRDIDQFLKKVEKKEDRVDRRILMIIEENVKKSHV